MTSCSLTRIERLLRARVAGEGNGSFYRTFAVSPSISLLSSRTARPRAKMIRRDAWQPMWAREDVCELFAETVSPFAENLGQSCVLFAANMGRVERCLWV